ncbi:thylakoid lumenal 17.9 kDa protein, chloroplastic isoform X2 [Andrographis paniculata]|uniref:thylakoid lumenal 17.9 kDa protein, chloroplastic isoform X2 n=1 Tax=Andrographis paniculata TaxID=175694 RepID=UPI0021E94ECA|nr:thylakoid lumenal 17.9 kDa protein, chloroplastic isoform X2 [Andrographis paniculata]
MVVLGNLLLPPPPLPIIAAPIPQSPPNSAAFCVNGGRSHGGNPKQRFSNRNNVGASSKPPGTSVWSNNLIALAIAVALISPLPAPAIPFVNSKPFVDSSATPYSQAQNLPTGLVNGKIGPCPSINPGCISSNPMSSNFAFPWRIVGYSSDTAAIQQLQDAILKTQKNANIQLVEDTPTGYPKFWAKFSTMVITC